MTLQTSGTISLLDVRCEFRGSAPDTLSEYSTCVGITAGSTISLCHYYGATYPARGTFFCGGYFVGCYGGYFIVVAPNASGCACCVWGPSYGVCNNTSFDDGYYNTRSLLYSTTYPAAYYTATRSINGYSDWYLPAINETSIYFAANTYMPTGEEFNTLVEYWSSTEYTSDISYTRRMSTGVASTQRRCRAYIVRAARRIPV